MNVKDQALQLPTKEKLKLLQALWEDLSRTEAEFELPVWHGKILAEREKSIDEGTASFLTVKEARAELKKRREG